jgi:hypothetical protein
MVMTRLARFASSKGWCHAAQDERQRLNREGRGGLRAGTAGRHQAR